MTANEWLVLDSLAHGWSYRTNLSRQVADETLADLTLQGLVADGRITDAGRAALMVANVAGTKEKASP